MKATIVILVRGDFPPAWWRAWWGRAQPEWAPLPVSPLPQPWKARLLFSPRNSLGLRWQQLWLERKWDCQYQLFWEWHYSIPRIFCTQEPSSSPLHSLLSVWQTGQLLSFSSYPRRRKQGFSTQMRSWTITNGWEQRAKEQYQHAAFSLRRVPTCFRTDSSLDSHCAHTCPRDVPSPCHIRTLLCNTSHAWHGAAVGPGMKTWGNTVALPGVSTGC